MTAGFYSPLPPARTGVADYAAALLAALRRLGQVEVNAAQADVRLYHLGNNHLHRTIYAEALRHPGVAVLHDAVLHHFFLGLLGRQEYVEEFVYNYGEWGRGLAADLWAGRSRSAQDPRYFAHPMLKRICAVSRAVIVHNPGAAKMAAAHAPQARVVEIPFLFQAPPLTSAAETERLRRALGLDGRTFLFGIFGFLRESKRLLTVLRTFEKVRKEDNGVALLVAGEFGSSDLERASAGLLTQPGIVRRGYVPPDEFWKLAAITDAVVNLRYPAAGETSAIAIPFMGIGKPVLVTAGDETARFPETACLRIDAGPPEAEMLAVSMLWLARNRGRAREIGERAATYIREQHAIENVARRYWEVLTECAVA